MANGRPCENVRNECSFHATDDARRCESALDKDPTVRCKRPRQDGSSFCPFHQDYPNLSKNLKAFVDEIGASALQEGFLETFFKRFYASTTAPRPDVEPFFDRYFKPATTPTDAATGSD
jgi:hypothetical protein